MHSFSPNVLNGNVIPDGSGYQTQVDQHLCLPVENHTANQAQVFHTINNLSSNHMPNQLQVLPILKIPVNNITETNIVGYSIGDNTYSTMDAKQGIASCTGVDSIGKLDVGNDVGRQEIFNNTSNMVVANATDNQTQVNITNVCPQLSESKRKNTTDDAKSPALDYQQETGRTCENPSQ